MDLSTISLILSLHIAITYSQDVILFTCDFENQVLCPQLNTTKNAWKPNSFGTPVDGTGPSKAANGEWYAYFDSFAYPTGGVLVYNQKDPLPSNNLVLSFNLHAYGQNCLKFEVKFKNASGAVVSAPNALVVSGQLQSSNNDAYKPIEQQFNLTGPFQTIEFIATSNGIQANYAIDDIVLKAVQFPVTCPSTCHPNATCVGTSCVCKSAFIGDGVNNCSATCTTACHPNATCVGTSCICKSGFIGDGVNNCTATCTSVCHPNATCVGTSCICKSAFIGDGVNNCSATCPTACHPNATCVGTTCTCKSGFTGDGINTCSGTCSTGGVAYCSNVILFTCNFENQVLCPQLNTTNNAWKPNSFGTPVDGTGPSKAANGEWYAYFDSFAYPTGGVLVYNQKDPLPSNNLVLSFNLHAYGQNCLKFEVKFKNASGAVVSAPNALVVSGQLQSSNNDAYKPIEQQFNLTGPFQTIEFIATSNGIQANYAIDDIVLKAVQFPVTCPSTCHPNATCVGTSCVCKSAFIGDGVNNCSATCTTACHPNATCVGTSCICKSGFIGDGVNNCTATCTSVCHPNATCVGTSCICKSAFIGDGVNNCSATCPTACHPNATCVGTTCTCKSGFTGDGINTCSGTCSTGGVAYCSNVILFTCNFENQVLCPQLNTTNNAWKPNSFGTPVDGTGPSKAANGEWYAYFDSFAYPTGGVLVYNQKDPLPSNNLVLSFNLHAYGQNCLKFEVKFKNASGAVVSAPNALVVSGQLQSSNNDAYKPIEQQFNLTGPFQTIEFIATSNGIRANYAIDDIVLKAVPLCLIPCHPNATCNGTTCTCKTGFIGDGVNSCVAICTSACHPNATCVGTSCICKSGFIGDGVNNCAATCTSACHPNATCVGTSCICKNGFIGDGVNNCTATCTSACHPNATCVGTSCICKSGFIGDGVNNCAATCTSACHPNATCVGTSCICKNGFIGDGVNNCAATCTSACHPNATCVGTSCICKNGFIGDGVNNCAATCTSACHPNATCVGTSCICKNGFIGDGVNNCAASCKTVCHPNALCSGNTCVCKSGFYGDGIISCEVTCSTPCHPNAICSGTTCICKFGYVGDGITDCRATCPTACHPNALCQNTTCVCKDGFTGDGINTCFALPTTFTPWGNWSPCSEPVCGSGTQYRLRSCLTQCNAVTSSDLNQTSTCKTPICYPNTLTQWTEYSDCTSSCGSSGVRSRSRSCTPLITNGCSGISLFESLACEQVTCPLNALSAWSDWTNCSSSCINSINPTQWRWRSCNCGSCSQCDSSVVESRTCNNVQCDLSCRSSAISYIIVIDSSSSVSDISWAAEKEFVKRFAATVGFNTNYNVNFGLVNFASTAKIEFSCGVFKDQASFNAKMDSITPIKGGTAINNGLALATTLLQSSDCIGKKVLLFTTDGEENIETNYATITATEQVVRNLANFIYIPYVNNPDINTHPNPAALDRLVSNGKGIKEEYSSYTDVNSRTDIAEKVLSGLCMDSSSWTSWSAPSQCSVSCGGTGFIVRKRTCLNGVNIAYNCPGADYNVTSCSTLPCSYLSSWNPWSSCSSVCRQNASIAPFQTRTRSCVQYATPCQGVLSETRECNTNLFCGGSWGEWGAYSACSASCNLGADYTPTRVRSRSCLNNDFSVGCEGSSTDVAFCNTEIGCPGILTQWSSWSGCEGQCQKVPLTSEYRNRRCVDASLSLNCNGEILSQSRPCFQGIPCQGLWSGWSNWTECSQSCLRINQSQPYQNRSRICQGNTLAGNCYNGQSFETQTCNADLPCPGQWSEWGVFTACSESCQSNIKMNPTQVRRRVCENAGLGGTCEGGNGSNEQYQTVICNYLAICPVMGTWTAWSAWGECSESCNLGISTRRRICTEPNIPSAGNDCIGNATQVTTCNYGDCPKSCNIPKRCNCSGVPQFENFSSFSNYYNLNMTSVNEVLLRVAPWTFDSVNQTCESCNIARLSSSLDHLIQDMVALDRVKFDVEALIDDTKDIIVCNSVISINKQLWDFYDYLYERNAFIASIYSELEAFRIRFDGAISACKQYSWLHQLIFNMAEKF